jgi:hypothetical protein
MTRLVTLLVSALAALLCTAPVWHGWYADQDSMRPFIHGREIAEQWSMFHLIPVWSSTFHMAYGSPEPLLYQKTFSYLTGLFDLLGASNAVGVGAALALTMFAGILIMARAVRIVLDEPHPIIETACGITAISCNYATTDWLVRGDDAEFTAQMLLPLLLAWCIVLIRENRCRLWIAPIMALLVISHSGTALYALLPLAIAVIFAALRWRNVRHWIMPGLTSIAVFAALLAPLVLPAIAMLRYAQTDFLHATGTPATLHVAFWKLFWFQPWRWTLPHGLNPFATLSLQLDPALLLGAAAMAALLLGRHLRTRPRAAETWTALFLLAVVVACLTLQTRQAAPLFELLPYLDYIQFAWRLLAFISVALILVAAMVLRALPGRALKLSCAAALVLSTAPNKFWPQLHQGWRMGTSAIDTMDRRYEDPLEYGPRIAGENEWQAAVTIDRVTGTQGRCPARWYEDMRRDHAKAHLDVTCPAAGPTALPLFLPPGLHLRIGANPLPAIRCPGDPRPFVNLPTGNTRITVLFPNWSSVVASLFHAPAGDPPGQATPTNCPSPP